MRSKNTLTKKDIVVILSCMILLLINLRAIGSASRERAKRAVCLNNLKMLTLAWTQFANDNNGNIVNGAAGIVKPGEPPWVLKDWADNCGILPLQEQQDAIEDGALWDYCKNLKLYHCPYGLNNNIRSYSIVDSMNGTQRNGTQGQEGVYITNMAEIDKPRERAVFIDVGRVTVGSFAVHYLHNKWWYAPPVHHSDGTNFSFADGHGEHWQWKGTDTVRCGIDAHNSCNPSMQRHPETVEGFEDLYRMQNAVWGKLGYHP